MVLKFHFRLVSSPIIIPTFEPFHFAPLQPIFPDLFSTLILNKFYGKFPFRSFISSPSFFLFLNFSSLVIGYPSSFFFLIIFQIEIRLVAIGLATK